MPHRPCSGIPDFAAIIVLTLTCVETPMTRAILKENYDDA